MSTITAERVGQPRTRMQTLYKLSAPTTSKQHPAPFEYVLVSLGRQGDTCVFPADADGRLLDGMGFGFAMGPGYWLVDDEFDAFVQECLDQHELDGGTASKFYPIAGRPPVGDEKTLAQI